MKLTTLFRVFAVVLVAVTLVMAYLIWSATRVPQMGGDFTLNYRGQPWTFSQNAKPLNLLYIGYVKCPDVCPLSLSNSGQAFQGLTEKERQDLQLIFISVDAAHDTAASVADYAKNFFPDFIGLTGTEAQITKAVSLFGASYMVEEDPKSYLGYSIIHTDRLFFLNSRGKVIDSISNPRSAAEILTHIRKNL